MVLCNIYLFTFIQASCVNIEREGSVCERNCRSGRCSYTTHLTQGKIESYLILLFLPVWSASPCFVNTFYLLHPQHVYTYFSAWFCSTDRVPRIKSVLRGGIGTLLWQKTLLRRCPSDSSLKRFVCNHIIIMPPFIAGQMVKSYCTHALVGSLYDLTVLLSLL